MMQRAVRTAILVLVAMGLGGCFSEQSFPMVASRLAWLPAKHVKQATEGIPARQWTVEANQVAEPLLPSAHHAPLTTDDFAAHGGVLDVYQYFGIDPARVDNLFANLDGLEQTAQVSSPPSVLDKKGHIFRPAWEGFEDVEIPVGGKVTLFGRIGSPDVHNAAVAEVPGSYIVITHGLFGSLDGLDMANEVEALRRAGHHVLAVEMRGHGETNAEHPEYAVSFGIRESADLLAVASWLKTEHGATRVGLVSFSLTGYEALLTAWLDGKESVKRFDDTPLTAALPEHFQRDASYNGGMFIVSPPIDLVAVANQFERRYDVWTGPCKAQFQMHVAERMALIQQAPTYSLWGWAASEFRRGGFEKLYTSSAALKVDLLRFIDLRGNDWEEGVRRMENIRVPVLMMASANDPLATAQGVAELFARVKNPNIGVVMLPGGGHMGFPALSADYYYSMMLNFFDPLRGPGVTEVGRLAEAP